MEEFQTKVRMIVELAGFNEPAVDFDLEARKINIFVNEGEWLKQHLPSLVAEVDHLVKLIAKRDAIETFYVDINSYRRERERLIAELAKAAARKASMDRAEVSLPVMNAYERRLVHTELAMHPEVTTESSGEGRSRHVVVKPLPT